jgi:hypothetical protein
MFGATARPSVPVMCRMIRVSRPFSLVSVVAHVEFAGHHVGDESRAVFPEELDLAFEAGNCLFQRCGFILDSSQDRGALACGWDWRLCAEESIFGNRIAQSRINGAQQLAIIHGDVEQFKELGHLQVRAFHHGVRARNHAIML